MKSKILAYAFIPAVLSFGLLGTSLVSAHGLFGGVGNSLTPDQIATRQQNAFTEEATVLGISVDEVKAEWAQGKTFKQIITDKNLNQNDIQARMQAARQAQMKTQLQTLVDKGIITQAQANARLAFMTSKLASGKGHRGMGMRFRF